MSRGVFAAKDDVADGLAAGRRETVQGRRSVEFSCQFLARVCFHDA